MAIGIDAKADAKADQRVEGKERIQRVRIGLTGLAVVFLLVMIGAAITNWGATPMNAATNQAIANAVPAEPNEPLAEIGAAPGASSTANAAASKKK